MVQTKLFTSNKSQAVRLPRAVAFPEGVTKVEIIADGDMGVIVPVRPTFREWFEAGGPFFSDDFMTEREGTYETREDL